MLLMQGMAALFSAIDVLVAPFKGSPPHDATNLTGPPPVADQNGFDYPGPPTGSQFNVQQYGEANALRLALAYQDATGFHLQHPQLPR
jgi:Asp-tRNA(Asn)/Glu-tRNA(Gln) amidotransferase A subunit family amidase